MRALQAAREILAPSQRRVLNRDRVAAKALQAVTSYFRLWWWRRFRHEGVVGELFCSVIALFWAGSVYWSGDEVPRLRSLERIEEITGAHDAQTVAALACIAAVDILAIVLPLRWESLSRVLRWCCSGVLALFWVFMLQALWGVYSGHSTGFFYLIPCAIYSYSVLYLLQGRRG